jgi:hypothetical protein
MHKLFGNSILSLSGMIFLAFTSSFMQSSVSAYTISISIFFILLTKLILFALVKNPNGRLVLAGTLCAASLPLIRFELILLIPFYFAWSIYSLSLNSKNWMAVAKGMVIFAIVLGVFVQSYLEIFATNRYNAQNGPHSVAVTNIFSTWNGYFFPLMNNSVFGMLALPICFALCFLAALSAVRSNRMEALLFMGIPGIILFAFYLSLSYLTFWHGAILLCFFSMIAAVGFQEILDMIPIQKARYALIAVLAIVLVWHGASDARIPKLNESYLLTQSASIIHHEIEKNCTVFNPYHWTLSHYPDMDVKNIGEFGSNDGSCNYFFDDYNCHIEFPEFGPNRIAECREFKKNFPLTPILTIFSDRYPRNHTLYFIGNSSRAHKTIRI